MGKAKHYIAVAVLVILTTLGLRVVLFYLYQLPDAASAQAGPIDKMFDVHFWLIAFLFSLIMVIMLYSVIVFRKREGDEEPGPHIHGHTGLEILWTIIPVLVVLGFGYWGVTVLSALTAEQPGEMTINVYGQQWSWEFEYPEQEGAKSRNLLVLPVNQNIVFDMQSRDVLHSFWIPEFRVKQDLIPDTTTYLRITPTEEGDYKLRCAEICGFDHSKMLADVQVVNQSEFDAWIEERLDVPVYAELSPEERGALWYEELGCNSCHSLDGAQLAGPTWQGIYGRQEELSDGTTVTVDDAYIRESIMDPNAKIVAGFAEPSVMASQGFETRIPEREAELLANEGIEIDIIDDLIAFMKTIEE
jgi:cytochrome c oxidase subunit 2